MRIFVTLKYAFLVGWLFFGSLYINPSQEKGFFSAGSAIVQKKLKEFTNEELVSWVSSYEDSLKKIVSDLEKHEAYSKGLWEQVSSDKTPDEDKIEMLAKRKQMKSVIDRLKGDKDNYDTYIKLSEQELRERGLWLATTEDLNNYTKSYREKGPVTANEIVEYIEKHTFNYGDPSGINAPIMNDVRNRPFFSSLIGSLETNLGNIFSSKVVKALCDKGYNFNEQEGGGSNEDKPNVLFAIMLTPKLHSDGTSFYFNKDNEKSNLQTIQALIECGLDLNTRDTEGRTVLMLAAEKLPFSFSKLLIERGAEIFAEDNEGCNVLCYAAMQEGYGTLRKILNYLDNAEVKDQWTKYHNLVIGLHGNDAVNREKKDAISKVDYYITYYYRLIRPMEKAIKSKLALLLLGAGLAGAGYFAYLNKQSFMDFFSKDKLFSQDSASLNLPMEP